MHSMLRVSRDFPYVLILWSPYLTCAKKCSSENSLVFLNIGLEVVFHRVTYSFASPLMSVYSKAVPKRWTCVRGAFFWTVYTFAGADDVSQPIRAADSPSLEFLLKGGGSAPLRPPLRVPKITKSEKEGH